MPICSAACTPACDVIMTCPLKINQGTSIIYDCFVLSHVLIISPSLLHLLRVFETDACATAMASRVEESDVLLLELPLLADLELDADLLPSEFFEGVKEWV